MLQRPTSWRVFKLSASYRRASDEDGDTRFLRGSRVAAGAQRRDPGQAVAIPLYLRLDAVHRFEHRLRQDLVRRPVRIRAPAVQDHQPVYEPRRQIEVVQGDQCSSTAFSALKLPDYGLPKTGMSVSCGNISWYFSYVSRSAVRRLSPHPATHLNRSSLSSVATT